MMKENYYYYTRYVRPDNLVLQSLLTVMEKIGLCQP